MNGHCVSVVAVHLSTKTLNYLTVNNITCMKWNIFSLLKFNLTIHIIFIFQVSHFSFKNYICTCFVSLNLERPRLCCSMVNNYRSQLNVEYKLEFSHSIMNNIFSSHIIPNKNGKMKLLSILTKMILKMRFSCDLSQLLGRPKTILQFVSLFQSASTFTETT